MRCRMFMSIPGLCPQQRAANPWSWHPKTSANIAKREDKIAPTWKPLLLKIRCACTTRGVVYLYSFSPYWWHRVTLQLTGDFVPGRGWGWPGPQQEATVTYQVTDELVHQLLPAPCALAGRRGPGTARRLLPLGPGGSCRRRRPPRALQKALGQRQVPRGLLPAPRRHLGPAWPPLGCLGPPSLSQRLGLCQLLLPAPAELIQAVVVHSHFSWPERPPRPCRIHGTVPPPEVSVSGGNRSGSCTRVPGRRSRPRRAFHSVQGAGGLWSTRPRSVP